MANTSSNTAAEPIERILVAVVIILVTLAFGIGYGHANHNTYLIEGLTKLDPSFLKYDWFARETIHYHPTFSYVVKIAALGGSLPWNLALLNSLLTGVSLFFLYKLSMRMSSTNGLALFLLFMFMVVIERTSSVSGSFMFDSYLQPSTFGYCLTMVALWYFVKENYLVSGLVLTGAAVFHTNFLLLGFVVFGFAHCLLGRDRLAYRLVLQLGGSALLLLYNLPFLFEMATHADADRAREIFTMIRSPHHYLPLKALGKFAPFYGWHLLAIASLNLADIDAKVRRPINAIYLALLATMILATLLTTVVFVPFVSQLFFWRLAPFAVLLAQLITLSAAVRYLVADRSSLPAVSLWRLVTLAAGVAVIAAWYQHRYALFQSRQVAMALYVSALLALLLLRRSPRRHDFAGWPAASVHALALAMLLVGFWATSSKTIENSSLLNGFPGRQEAELYAWVRRTDDDATFVIPPDMMNFRMHGARAIVVDWKSIPVDPDGALEWHARLAHISGVERFESKNEVMSGYSTLDANRIGDLRERYRVTHIVLYVDTATGDGKNRLKDFPTVFRNQSFEVKAIDPRRSS